MQSAFVQCKSFFFLSLSLFSILAVYPVCLLHNYLVYIYITEILPPLFMNFSMWTGVGHTLSNQSALRYISLVFSLIYCVLLFFTKVLHSCQWIILQQCIAAMLLYWWCPKFTLVSVREYSCSCGWMEQIFTTYV